MKAKQTGATVVEFALVLIIFLTFFLGIVDFARMLWTWNAANEATRWGARVAVVCVDGHPDLAGNAFVLTKMQFYLPQLTGVNVVGGNVQIDWYNALDAEPDATCNHTNCAGVSVSITNLNYQWISPIAGVATLAPIPMPGFSTYLPREIMGQDPNSNSVCS